jgi:hypothetical protein
VYRRANSAEIKDKKLFEYPRTFARNNYVETNEVKAQDT